MDLTGSMFIDSSLNRMNIYPQGSASQSTAQKVFGSASALFSSSTIDALKIIPSASTLYNFIPSNGDFQIDFWYMPTDIVGIDHTLFKQYSNNEPGVYPIDIYRSGSFVNFSIQLKRSYYDTGSYDISGTIAEITQDTWSHLALLRQGYSSTWLPETGGGRLVLPGEFAAYHNGSQSFFLTSSLYVQPSTSSLYIGGADGNYGAGGYIDEFRFLRGEALWTGSFVPPSESVSSGSVTGSSYYTPIYFDIVPTQLFLMRTDTYPSQPAASAGTPDFSMSASSAITVALPQMTSSIMITNVPTMTMTSSISMSFGSSIPLSCSVSFSTNPTSTSGSFNIYIIPSVLTPAGMHTLKIVGSNSEVSGSSRSINVPFVVPDGPATIDSFSPATGSNVHATDPIGFRVYDPNGFAYAAIYVEFKGKNIYEVAHDGTSFGPMYKGISNSMTVGSLNTYVSYTLLRDGGWISAPTIIPKIVNISGTLG